MGGAAGMTTSQTRFTRRRFLSTAVSTGAMLFAPQVVPSSALGRDGKSAPSERVVMGGIGIGNRGEYDLGIFLGQPCVQFVAASDVRAARRTAVKELVDSFYGNSDCATYRDMADLLARDDIEACLIATGERWHAEASIATARAGKDIFCETPCSMTIEESRRLADQIARHRRVFQAGTVRRNVANFSVAQELVRTGRLGQLRAVHANTSDPTTRAVWLAAQPEPSPNEVDWNLWLGPAPWRPYNEAYLRGRWRGYSDFHGGGLLEWGSHTVDLCQRANGADDTAPIQYEPDGTTVTAVYGNGVRLVLRDQGWLGLGSCSVRFEGDEGWVETGDSGRVATHPANLAAPREIGTVDQPDPTAHIVEFLECVRSRGEPAGNARVGSQSH
ncbi:MAG: Gfo/Idh/MocA family oxidoreductase, partial [Planctomycetes bacterium]|nr:Gfo/Idh/MocA family oxidoreductase [Planctomycetota bacterium]